MAENEEAQAPQEEMQDLSLDNIDSLDAVVELGKICVAFLKGTGSVTFIVDAQRNIRTVNPLSVYFDARTAHPPDGAEPRFVRPILHNRKPQYVARKEDGSLWEVEYPDNGLEENTDKL